MIRTLSASESAIVVIHFRSLREVPRASVLYAHAAGFYRGSSFDNLGFQRSACALRLDDTLCSCASVTESAVHRGDASQSVGDRGARRNHRT
jgi:hypothetical protein